MMPETSAESHRENRSAYALRVGMSVVATFVIGLIVPFGGGLVTGALLAFTVLRRDGMARWWVLALGAVLTLFGFYLVVGSSTVSVS